MKKITCAHCGSDIKLYKHDGTYMTSTNGLLNTLLSSQGREFVCAKCMVKENSNFFFAMQTFANRVHYEMQSLESELGLPTDYQMACELKKNYKPYSIQWYLSDHKRLVKIYAKDYLPIKAARLDVPESFEATVALFKDDIAANMKIHDAFKVKATPITVNAIGSYLLDNKVLSRAVETLKTDLKYYENAFMNSPFGSFGKMDAAASVFHNHMHAFNALADGLAAFGVNTNGERDIVFDLAEQLDSYKFTKEHEVEAYNEAALESETDEVLSKGRGSLVEGDKTYEIIETVHKLNASYMSKAKRAEALLNAYGMKRYVSTAKKYRQATDKFYQHLAMAKDLIENDGDALKALEAQAKTLSKKIHTAKFEDRPLLDKSMSSVYNKAARILDNLEDFHFLSQKAQARFKQIEAYAQVDMTREEVREILGGNLSGTLFENY